MSTGELVVEHEGPCVIKAGFAPPDFHAVVVSGMSRIEVAVGVGASAFQSILLEIWGRCYLGRTKKRLSILVHLASAISFVLSLRDDFGKMSPIDVICLSNKSQS